ncbi:hypothetical protein IH992_28760, partial [Candidatus Poribacteria bacterium]|nr:hypothetical protein [Candidatus Poribacteria bacterium]
MNEISPQERIEYFTTYAGEDLEIWNSIVGEQITHRNGRVGDVVGILQNDNLILVKIRFRGEQTPRKFPGKWLGRSFTNLTLSDEVERSLPYWDFQKDHLLDRLSHLSFESPLNQSTFEKSEETYDQLIRMHQAQAFPKAILQEVSRCRDQLRERLLDQLKHLAL